LCSIFTRAISGLHAQVREGVVVGYSKVLGKENATFVHVAEALTLYYPSGEPPPLFSGVLCPGSFPIYLYPILSRSDPRLFNSFGTVGTKPRSSLYLRRTYGYQMLNATAVVYSYNSCLMSEMKIRKHKGNTIGLGSRRKLKA